jgi:outer membrane protein OmpA-like peptidoglycan-associated protein
LAFPNGAAKIAAGAAKQLDEVARGMARAPTLRLELKAYAGGTASSASKSRRLSLSRALAVRSFLIDKGVRSTRIDVRALGDKYGSGPADRVDVTVTSR